MTAGLRAALESGRFAVTAEIGLPHGPVPDKITAKAELLAGAVDAANITDNPSATVLPSSLAGAELVRRAGVEPVMQLTCRDRNRIALQSDLLGAALLDIPNVLLLTGDHPRFGDHPGAKPVFDLDSVQLTQIARTLRDTGRLASGRVIEPKPRWLVGAVENPSAPPLGFRAERLAKKAAAGAEFVQTQFVFDLDIFRNWINAVRDLGITERCHVLAGVGPIRSPRALEFMRTNVPGVYIPDSVVRRLNGVPRDRFVAEGLRLCIELVQELKEMPGVSGVHIMAFGHEAQVLEITETTGIGPAASPLRAQPANVRKFVAAPPADERGSRHAG